MLLVREVERVLLPNQTHVRGRLDIGNARPVCKKRINIPSTQCALIVAVDYLLARRALKWPYLGLLRLHKLNRRHRGCGERRASDTHCTDVGPYWAHLSKLVSCYDVKPDCETLRRRPKSHQSLQEHPMFASPTTADTRSTRTRFFASAVTPHRLGRRHAVYLRIHS